MSDHSELKSLLEACKESNCADASDFGRRIADLYDYLDPETVAELVAENERMAALLECAQGDLKQAMQIIEKDSKPLDDLIAENEVLCSKIASMNVSGFGDAFYLVAERLGVTGARPVSPMQVFTTEVLPALDAVIKDAERYRWLRRTDCWEDAAYPGPWIVSSHDGVDNQDGDALDAAIDAAMSKEG